VKKAVKLRAILAQGSKSFSLASAVLPPACRDAAAAVYAFCRRCDDAIDETPRHLQPAALAQLRAELAAVYTDEPQGDLVLAAFQEVVRAYRIPREYPAELVEGMAMDARGQRYRDIGELSLYAYRVAGTVGLMMCHVMGVKHDDALSHAVHLGIALQLTNIARDVAEDWNRGRIYLPDDHLGTDAADRLHGALSGPIPHAMLDPIAKATMRLVREADDYYRAGDEGLRWLSLRNAIAIRSARWIYWGIGERVATRRGDPQRGRAVVPLSNKLLFLAQAVAVELRSVPTRVGAWSPTYVPRTVFQFGNERPA
jgi:15-cis-phytoene synthase